MVTAYDYPSAVHVARAGIDIVLVGDSAAMVEHGHETTQPITMDEMLWHCQSVKRGIDYAGGRRPLLMGDMPFGTYEFTDTDVALRNAYRYVKEAGVDAIKLEGGGAGRAETVQKIVEGGGMYEHICCRISPVKSISLLSMRTEQWRSWVTWG